MQEVMMKTLARAAASDTNIKSVEIDKVQEVLLARTGVGIPLRYVSLLTLLYSKRYLWINTARSAKNLKLDERVDIVKALREVIGSDERVSEMEQDFFNMVVEALDIPARIYRSYMEA